MIKNLPAKAGNVGSVLGWGRSPGVGNSNSLQYSCLGNPHGQRRLVGYSPRGCRESDTTGQLGTHFSHLEEESQASPLGTGLSLVTCLTSRMLSKGHSRTSGGKDLRSCAVSTQVSWNTFSGSPGPPCGRLSALSLPCHEI